MQFAQLKSAMRTVKFSEIREEGEDYFEAVLTKNELAGLTSTLNKFFGSPAWPSEKPLSAQARKVVEDFGDIMEGQTLYFWQEGNDAVFAMLWPWGDKNHVTLKIGKVTI